MLDRHRFANLSSSLITLLLVLAQGGCHASPSTPAAANAEACTDICACAGGQGVDEATCMQICTASAVATTTPADVCASDLESVGAGACVGHCRGLRDPAPGDSLGQCGAGVSAMHVGDSFTCELGDTVNVDYLALVVGCNDGETGTFSATFDDSSSASLQGSCGSATYLPTAAVTSTITLTMNAGGGSDGTISFTDLGSAGLFVGYW